MQTGFFTAEIRDHLMKYGRFTWIREILFAAGLHFISSMPEENPLLFYSFIFVLTGISFFNMWLCQVLDEWTLGNLKVWDWCFSLSSSLQYVMSSALISFVFFVDGPISWSGFAALMMWVCTFESIAQIYYHKTKFFYPLGLVLMIPGLAALIMHIEYDLKISLGVLFTALIYCFSVAAKVQKWKLKNKNMEELFLNIAEERSMIQKLFDMIPAKVSWIDSQSKYKMVNQELIHHLQVPSKSLLGSDFGHMQNPQYKELNHKIKAFLNSQQTESSFEHPVKIGTEIRRHHVILKKINSTKGQELIMMTLDIEDYKRNQSQNKAS